MPTQQDVRDQGECGNGFNYGGPAGRPRYCGEPSEPGATFGDCPEHAAEFRAHVRKIDRATARVTELGPRALRAIEAEREDPQRAITARGRAAQDTDVQMAGRRLASRTRRSR
jgi:hypothetical protein